MKWFKHYSDASDDSFIEELADTFGWEGYGRWWKLLEIIAANMEKNDQPYAEHSWVKWQSFLKGKRNKLETFLVHCQNKGKLKLEQNGNILKIICPKLLELRDNHSRNLQVADKLLAPKTKSKDLEEDKEKKVSKQVPPAGYTPEFLFFWEKYPRRDGSKSEAFKNYQAAIKKGFTHAGIIAGLEKFRIHVDSNKIGQKYIAHASTWLSQCRWESDYDNTKPYLDAKPGGSNSDPASVARDIGESIIAKRQAARLAGDSVAREPASPGRIDTIAIPDLRQPESLRGQGFDDGISGRDVSGGFG